MSATMTDKGHIMWRGAALAGMACLAAGACASGNRAPIDYAGALTPASHTAIAPRPPAAPAPLDLTAIPFEPAMAPVIIRDQPHSECVPYVRNVSGIAIWGDAVTWWAQAASRHVRSGRPAPGSVLVLRG